MTRTGVVSTCLVLCVAMIGLMGGCTKPNLSIYEDPGLYEMNFETITLLPVVDRRVDKSHEFDPEEAIGNKVEKRLNKKGYDVIRMAVFADGKDIPNDEVVEMETHELGVLGEAQTDYMMVVYLEDASSKTALGYTFKVEVTAILVKKESSTLLWKDKGIASRGQGGALGCLVSGAVKGEALNMAVNATIGSLPDAPSKRKL